MRAIEMIAGLAIAAVAMTTTTFAQENFPTQPVRIVVPYAAGGGTDVLARIVQADYKNALGGSVFIENAGGAGTLIGTERAIKATPDGHTILFTTGAIGLNTLLYKTPNYMMDDLV